MEAANPSSYSDLAIQPLDNAVMKAQFSKNCFILVHTSMTASRFEQERWINFNKYIACPPAEGGGAGVEPFTKFSKGGGGLGRISMRKRGVTFFSRVRRGGFQFLHKK